MALILCYFILFYFILFYLFWVSLAARVCRTSAWTASDRTVPRTRHPRARRATMMCEATNPLAPVARTNSGAQPVPSHSADAAAMTAAGPRRQIRPAVT